MTDQGVTRQKLNVGCRVSVQERLEYLRGELRAERISYAEISELRDYADAGAIDPGDVELLEAAGVPETNDEFRECLYGMPEYEGMTDEQATRVVERAAFYYGGGLRTVKGAVERAIADVRWWGL